MTNSKNYNPQEIESKWYAHWMQKDYFSSQPDEREAFSIVIPPPNVTGVLHMGHMLNNTIQDILIRRARMQGKNACWVPGTDHAAIATEAKVVQLLREQKHQKVISLRGVFVSFLIGRKIWRYYPQAIGAPRRIVRLEAYQVYNGSSYE